MSGPTVMVHGIDPNRAPLNLMPYLDSVDGALACGGKIDNQGRQTHTIWALHRGGVEVGRVVLEGTGQLRPYRTDLALARLRMKGLVEARLAREADRRARWRLVLIWAAALGYLALLVAVFALGYQTAPTVG